MTHQRYRASILLEADGSIFENAFFNVITFYIRTNGAVQHNSREVMHLGRAQCVDHDVLAPGPHPFIVGHAHWGKVMQETDSDREARLRELASRLLFTLRKEGSRFCLYREADVPQPVRHDDLTLDEVEETLNTWKLRGPHGG
jgi:hypothetical protein